MKNKKILIGLITIILFAVYVMPVGANDTGTISIQMSNTATAAITVSPDTWSPAAGLGEVADSYGTHFILTNTGNVTVTVKMNSADTGSGWSLALAPGHDEFQIEYNKTTTTTLTTDYDDCIMSDALPPSGGGTNTIQFGLILHMPTSTSTSNAQSTVVTIKATAN